MRPPAPLAQLRPRDEDRWREIYTEFADVGPGWNAEAQALAAEALGWPFLARRIRRLGVMVMHMDGWPDLSQPER